MNRAACVKGGVVNIVIIYDSSAANAPAGFKQAVQAAVQFYDYLITNPITVPIVFSYGEIQGQSISSNAVAESSTNGNVETFSSLVNLLAAAATSATDHTSIVNLPTSDPTFGGSFWVSDAQAQVFGLGSEPGYIDPEDGFVGISSQLPLTWDPYNRSVPGTYDAVGALEHEIAEVLGRYGYLGGGPTFNGKALYSPLDLFRFTGGGVRTVAYSAGYFSIDGGKTLQLQFNNPNNGGDGGDWASGLVGDSFGSAYSGVEGLTSPTDLQVMDVLGYQVAPLGNPTAGAAATLSTANGAAVSITNASIFALISNDYTGSASITAASLDPGSAGDGVLTIDTVDQTLVFTPAAGFAGLATATVTISDNYGGTVQQPINFNVSGGSSGGGGGGGLVINLGATPQTVTLTSAAQTVNGGAGAATINATASTAGALLKGGSGPMTLNISGGGVAAMNAGDTGVSAVNLLASASAYTFTANNQAGLVINDLSAAGDTIVLGSAGQTVNGGAGATTVNATAATAGALLKGGSAPLTLNIAGGGVAALNAGDTAVSAVNLQASSNVYTFTANSQAGLVINDLSAAGDTIALGSAGQTVNGGAGAVIVNATAATAGALLKGGSGPMTLNVAGGGVATLNAGDTGLGVVNLQTATGAYTFTANGAAGLVINDLSAAGDTIVLGAASQTVNGGAGAVTVNALAATAGALLKGGSGPMTLYVAGGGAAPMNAGDTGVGVVNLMASAGAYAFTANNEAGLVINDQSAGADTITAGGVQQTVTGGGAGKLTMVASAAGNDTFRDIASVFNGDTIRGFSGANNVIDVTDLNASKLTATFVENAAGTSGQLNLNDGTHSASIALFGQFMAAGVSGTAAAAGFTATADGAGGTKITYAAPPPNLVVNLGAAPSTVTLVSATETVNGGAGAATINATAATAGALLKGGGGKMTLNLTGGGVATLNAGDSGVGVVNLLASTTPYVFTANGEVGLVIYDKSAGADAIVVGSASDTVHLGAAGATVQATAALAGASVLGATGGDTLEITTGGVATLNASSVHLTVRLDQATDLNFASLTANNLVGSAGDDTVRVTTANLTAAAHLDGGGGTNTLVLTGGGTFNLATPAALANFQVIDVSEGQLASGGVASTYQTVTLRGDLNATVNVLTPAANPANPNALGVAIVGGADSDVINLGGGADVVTLGSAAEAVHGGAGTATVKASAATAGALLTGGAGLMTLNVSGGGVVTLNAGDTGVAVVNLLASSTAYVFTANGEAGLVINDQASSVGTLTLGGAQQTVTGGGAGKLTMIGSAAGGDTFRDTAALFNGDTIKGFAAPSDVIDVTNLNASKLTATFVENAAGTSGQLTLSDGSHSAKITLFGQFMAAGFSGTAAAAGFSATADGAGGTNITYRPVVAPPH